MEKMLDRIENSHDVKKLDYEELGQLCRELREEIISTVSKTGGHLASNLGVVELTAALHFVFDFPVDKLVWDVGHQSYVHKLLTGRRGRFHTLRQYGGVSGFRKGMKALMIRLTPAIAVIPSLQPLEWQRPEGSKAKRERSSPLSGRVHDRRSSF